MENNASMFGPLMLIIAVVMGCLVMRYLLYWHYFQPTTSRRDRLSCGLFSTGLIAGAYWGLYALLALRANVNIHQGTDRGDMLFCLAANIFFSAVVYSRMVHKQLTKANGH